MTWFCVRILCLPWQLSVKEKKNYTLGLEYTVRNKKSVIHTGSECSIGFVELNSFGWTSFESGRRGLLSLPQFESLRQHVTKLQSGGQFDAGEA
ncbi:hypothetical protein L1987_43938 [Smallanthus sonchifolius]|uniref:Uncharacterized protein n=1 Tax=Smallanthus sonchifolius TaxID=185202 RepID=A0ACB9GN70_9ASTR|nr:hypothetical protein L1987_43938 [Smallanthus sonchifolius]